MADLSIHNSTVELFKKCQKIKGRDTEAECGFAPPCSVQDHFLATVLMEKIPLWNRRESREGSTAINFVFFTSLLCEMCRGELS